MVIVYTLTIFASATLLFLVQPMFARQVLPLLGGSPAVWNTAMVFYQATLLAGYGYAHFTTTKFGARRQALWHTGLLLVPLMVLPIAVPAGWTPPPQDSPVWWLLALMVVAVGLPFFVVSASSPLLQKWLAQTNHPAARDPYFLYAASNAGSLLALLSYPFLLEPYLSLQLQTRLWSVGYLVFIVLMAACVFLLWRSQPASVAEEVIASEELAPAPPIVADKGGSTLVAANNAITNRRRARWVLLALVPSSLMLSVTTYISTDLAAVPLLWVVPLGIYLLTFIFVFSTNPPIRHGIIRIVLALLLVPLAVTVAVRATQPLSLLVSLHLMTFFIAAMWCHGELARDRPPARNLTEFYLWMSVGGVLGGAFNALLAPVLFNGFTEYPIALALVGGLLVWPGYDEQSSRKKWFDWTFSAVLAGLMWGLVAVAQNLANLSEIQKIAVIFALPALICFSFSRRPLRFALGLAAILWVGALYRGGLGDTLYAARSFFGVHRVSLDSEGHFHQIIHGGTLHGRQYIDPAKQSIPLTYYGRQGPVGQIFETLSTPSWPRRVGLVGLGAGTLAVYGKPGQNWTFYEIDPVVEHIARDPRYFTFLQQSQADIRIVIGDARLSLLAAPDGAYDILVLDAYSSDAIPIHLSTREALQLYLKKLAPRGVMVFHISNLHLDLEPVLGNLASASGLVALTRSDSVHQDKTRPVGVDGSQWVVMARRPADLGVLLADPRWKPTKTDSGMRLWTDDYSSILSVFRWD